MENFKVQEIQEIKKDLRDNFSKNKVYISPVNLGWGGADCGGGGMVGIGEDESPGGLWSGAYG